MNPIPRAATQNLSARQLHWFHRGHSLLDDFGRQTVEGRNRSLCLSWRGISPSSRPVVPFLCYRMADIVIHPGWLQLFAPATGPILFDSDTRSQNVSQSHTW